MKKLVLITLLLLMITPALASRDEYIGTWITSHLTSTGGATSEVFILTADGRSFYFNAHFTGSEPSFSRQYVGIWRYTSNGIKITYGDSFDEVTAYVQGDYLMLESPVGIVAFNKYTEYTTPSYTPPEADLSQAPDTLTVIPTDRVSVILPPGTYHGSTDIKPGTYSVKGNTSGEFVSFIYIDRNNTTDVGSYVLKGDEMLESFTITEGYEMRVYNGFLILNPVSDSHD